MSERIIKQDGLWHLCNKEDRMQCKPKATVPDAEISEGEITCPKCIELAGGTVEREPTKSKHIK